MALNWEKNWVNKRFNQGNNLYKHTNPKPKKILNWVLWRDDMILRDIKFVLEFNPNKYISEIRKVMKEKI